MALPVLPGPEFNSQQTHGGSQPSWNLMPSSGMLAYMQTAHSYIKNEAEASESP